MTDKSIPKYELVALIGVAVMLVAFVFLPWADVQIGGDLQREKTGMGILGAGQDTELVWTMKPTQIEVTVFDASDDEDETDIYLPTILSPIGRQGYFSLFLIPLAAIGGGVLTVWGLVSPDKRRFNVWIRRVLALGTWLCYFNFLDFTRFGKFDMVNIGFWVAWVSSIGLLFGVACKQTHE